MPYLVGNTAFAVVAVAVENTAAVAVDISVEGSFVGLHSFLAY